MSETKVKFVNGLRAYKPSDKAPTFIKANLTINRNELMMWLNEQPENIKIDLKESKGGTYYFSVDEYVAKDKMNPPADSWQKEKFMKDINSLPDEIITDNSLPF